MRTRAGPLKRSRCRSEEGAVRTVSSGDLELSHEQMARFAAMDTGTSLLLRPPRRAMVHRLGVVCVD
jgi:hypothetical protein